jgi:hypothetical protein
MFDPERVEALLMSLGDEPQEIAARSADAGCYGVRLNPCRCPVVHWLQRFGIESAVRIGVVTDGYLGYGRLLFGLAQCVRQPQPIFDFVQAFDAGEFPWLEAA